jgi:hypothetical protein
MQFSKLLPKSISVWSILLLALVLGVLKFTHLQNNILSYDYFGLYLYLPATFIYNDPAISDLAWLNTIIETYKNTPTLYQLQAHEGYNIIRFYSGMAILLSPFFFLGHAAALLTQWPADGFSVPYQLAMTFAAWFYVVVGLLFIRKVLLKFFQEKVVAISLIALYLGSNLFFWTTFDAGAPHTILFSLYAMLLWFTIRWHEEPKASYAAAIGLLLGLIIVSRPSEIIAIAIPLFWNVYNRQSLNEKVKLVAKNIPHLILLSGFTILAGLPQMLYYIVFTGSVFFSTYNDPQSIMDWGNPQFLRTFFSYRKGWLVYAPIMIFSIAGLGLLVRKHKQLVLPLVVFFLLNLYFISSFTSLISYGWRAFIQSYALMAIPFAAVIDFIFRRHFLWKWLSTILLAAFIVISTFQAWQLMQGIIHGSRMTKAYYWQVFMKSSITKNDLKLLRVDLYSDEPDYRIKDSANYASYSLISYDFSGNSEEFNTMQQIHPNDTTKFVLRLNKETPYSKAVKIPYSKITDKNHFWARISYSVYAEDAIAPNELRVVATFTYQGKKQKFIGKPYKYRALPAIRDIFTPGQWHHYSIDYLSPEVTSKNDRFESYLWNLSDKTVLISHFEVEVFEPIY